MTLHNVALAGQAGRSVLFTRPGEDTSLVASTRPERGGSARTEVEAVTLSSRIEEEVDLLNWMSRGRKRRSWRRLLHPGSWRLIREMLVEYHHNVGGEVRLSPFLALLEEQGFEYRLKSAPRVLRDSHGGDQDVLVWAYRRVCGSGGA